MFNFSKNSIISVESDSDPGMVHKYLVTSIGPDNTIKLVYQDHHRIGLRDHHQLSQYLQEHHINQNTLSDILGKSRSTICRYLSGKLPIPDWVFKKVGMKPTKTNLQVEAYHEELLRHAVALREYLDSFINFIQG